MQEGNSHAQDHLVRHRCRCVSHDWIGTWIGVRTLTPSGALAGATDQLSVMLTGAKGAPTSLYDDYSIVAY
jgi:hypothetical protein